jgi:MFS transporter, DHA3 family, macrolide efflux protein
MVVGTGFVALSASPALWVAVAAAAVAAVGGPMGDLVLLTMIQTEQPSERIGKVYGLLGTTSSTGSVLGLALEGFLFPVLGPRAGMACLSLVVVAAGATGLFRFRGTKTGTHRRRRVRPVVDDDS